MVEFDLEDQYPEASGEQKQVLKILDRTIWDMKHGGDVALRIPPLTKQEVQATWRDKNPAVLDPSFGGCLCRSLLGWPLVSFAVTVLLSLGGVYCVDGVGSNIISNSDFLQYILPGLISILGLIGASIPIRSRFWGFAKVIGYYNQPEMVQKVADEAVDEQIVLHVANKVDLININLILLVDSMKSQLILSPSDRARYLKVDPTLPEMPANPSDYVEEDLRDAKNELRESVAYFIQEDPRRVAQSIPNRFTSPKAYYWRGIVGNMFVFFVFQCVLVYGTFWLVTMYYPIVAEEAEPFVKEAIDEVDHLLEPFGTFNLHDTATTQALLWICALSFEAYLYSCYVVGVVYSKTTSVTRMVRISNQVRAEVSVATTATLRQHGIIFLCRDILELRTERTKARFLTLIRHVYRLEMLRDIVDGDCGTAAVAVPTARTTRPAKRASSFYSFGAPSSPSTSSTADLSKMSPVSTCSLTADTNKASTPLPSAPSMSRRWQNTFGSWGNGGTSSANSAPATQDQEEDVAFNGGFPDEKERKLPAQ